VVFDSLECTKFVFGRVFASDPTRGAQSAPPDLLLGLRGPISEQGRGGTIETERGREGRDPLPQISGSSSGYG